MTILYLGFGKTLSSIDGVYIKGLRKNGVRVIDYSFHGLLGIKRFTEVLRSYFRHRKEVDIIMAGYDSPFIVWFLWPVCRKPIVYNALCSVYERLIVSRNLAAQYSLKAAYYWLEDFLACLLSRVTLLETNHQIEYFQKLFKLPSKKFFRAWIGVDDERFRYQPHIEKYPEFTVLFRGRLLPEAGAEVAVETAKILEHQPVQFLMLANGMLLPKIQSLIEKLKPKNLKLITEFLPDEKLYEIMHKCHVSLGQLNDHERLERTIPHKAYESIALRLPYLTARNPAVMELFEEGKTCLAFEPANPKDLVEKILWAKHHPVELEQIAQNGYNLYLQNLTSEKLAQALLERIQKV